MTFVQKFLLLRKKLTPVRRFWSRATKLLFALEEKFLGPKRLKNQIENFVVQQLK